MNGLSAHLKSTIRLYFRNPMALLYGYLFPIIFLVAFWVYYMSEKVPLWYHMGQLLAVTALSGVCFGLPTTLVSERERGVWRRYKLTPVPTSSLVASTILARYLTTITTGLLQIGLAMLIGMPMPNHPIELFIAFSFVCFGFVGMGLVVATMADTVPAVQALGQCLFLPLLMIGGVAVSLSSLPTWAQHVSAFFPGRFAVQAMDASIRGHGLVDARFSLIALTIIGAAAIYAGTKLFRWDSQQRFAIRDGKAMIAVALSSWILVGLAAEWRGRVLLLADSNEITFAPSADLRPAAVPPKTTDIPKEPPVIVAPAPAPAPVQVPIQAPAPAPVPVAPPSPAVVAPPPVAPAATATTTAAATPPPTSGKKTWKDMEFKDWWGLPFDDLPPDSGVEAPMARGDDETTPDIEAEIKTVQRQIPTWEPAMGADPVQRVRNLIYVAVVVDAGKWQSERWMPWAIYYKLAADYPAEDLKKILTYIALHPEEGDASAADDLRYLGLFLNPPGEEELRRRTMWYATKFVAIPLNKATP